MGTIFGTLAGSCGRGRRVAAFSLVEVALAIGVVAFAFVGLFALLPAGMGLFRQSIDNSVGSQIVQRLVGEAQQTEFPSLIGTATTTRYFDELAKEVTANDSIYTAEVSVLPKTEVPAANPRVTDSLVTVTIKLANNPGRLPSPFASGSKVPYATYFAYIAKSQ